MSNNKKMI